jgi:HEAT repeat protein
MTTQHTTPLHHTTRFVRLFFLIPFILTLASAAHAQTMPLDGVDARSNPADFAKQLSSADPNVRRRCAEALARLAATDQRKLVEGYQLEEKNKEVRLALDWALYRMGRAEALYRVVDDLDSSRQDQAIGYLAELDSPDLLYPFLKRDTNRPRLNAGLLKALGRIGDAQTLDLIKPFRESPQPYVAEAAELAHDEIAKRLAEPAAGETRARPRTVEKATDKP